MSQGTNFYPAHFQSRRAQDPCSTVRHTEDVVLEQKHKNTCATVVVALVQTGQEIRA